MAWLSTMNDDRLERGIVDRSRLLAAMVYHLQPPETAVLEIAGEVALLTEEWLRRHT